MPSQLGEYILKEPLSLIGVQLDDVATCKVLAGIVAHSTIASLITPKVAMMQNKQIPPAGQRTKRGSLPMQLGPGFLNYHTPQLELTVRVLCAVTWPAKRRNPLVTPQYAWKPVVNYHSDPPALAEKLHTI